MTLPKAILICSLFTTYLTKADVTSGWCGNSIEEWNPWYVSVGSGLTYSQTSACVQWGRRNRNINNLGERDWIAAYSLRNGQRLADILLPATLRVRVHDWEAIAVNRENGTSYIYLADIGDKKFKLRSSRTIYKFKEPRVSNSWQGHNIVIHSRDIKRIHIKFADHVHDCEAMVVDPQNGDFLCSAIRENRNFIATSFQISFWKAQNKYIYFQ